MTRPESSSPDDLDRLRRTARRYEALVQAEGGVVWVVDSQLRPTGRNLAWERYSGQTSGEYADRGWLDAVHPDDRERFMTESARAMASRTPFTIEFRLRRFDGQYRRNVVRAIPVEDEGQVVEWIGTATDIEDTRLAADEIAQKMEAALTEQQDLRRRAERHALRMAFLADASAALSSLDYEATLREIARLAVPRITDWCAVDIVQPGGSLARLVTAHVDPAKVDLARELQERYPEAPNEARGVTNALRTGKPEFYPDIPDEMLVQAARDEEHLRMMRELGLHSALVVPLTARDRTLGAITFVSARAEHPITDEDVTVLTEVGRRAALAIDNARLYRDAEFANRAKDEFLALLSHELRTPLNAIMGWSHMLRQGLPEDMQQHALQVIGRNAQTQKQLVEDLLDVARIAAGRLDLQPATVDIRDVARTAVDSALPAAQTKGLTLQLETPRSPALVEGDLNRLQQVTSNLLSNALKFTDTGGRITVRVSASPTGVTLTVSDTGVGISPEFLPHVFERFRQGDTSLTRAYSGLGLGLWVVHQIVEGHGGSVHADSGGHGYGATVGFTLPASTGAPRY